MLRKCSTQIDLVLLLLKLSIVSQMVIKEVQILLKKQYYKNYYKSQYEMLSSLLNSYYKWFLEAITIHDNHE